MTLFELKRSRLCRILLLLTFLGVCSSAYALEGYYTEEEVRTFPPAGGPDKIVIRKSWYAGDRMRKEEGWMGITIARFDLGSIFVLQPRSRTYFVVSPEVLQSYSTLGLLYFGAQKDAEGKLYFPDDLYIRTETTKEIGPWSCYEVVTNPKYRSPRAPYAVFWYSTEVDFPVQLFGDQLKQLFGNSPLVDGLFQRITQFEGYPIRVEAHGSAYNIMTTLIRIQRRTDIDPSLFEVPADYSEEAVPEDIPLPRWGP